MQKTCFIILLILGLASGWSVCAQTSESLTPGLLPRDQLPGRLSPLISGIIPWRDSLRLQALPPAPRASFHDQPPHDRLSVQPVRDSVRIMAPDRMPCLVPDLTRLEKMPVRKLQNRRPHDPMPNAPVNAMRVPRPQMASLP